MMNPAMLVTARRILRYLGIRSVKDRMVVAMNRMLQTGLARTVAFATHDPLSGLCRSMSSAYREYPIKSIKYRLTRVPAPTEILRDKSLMGNSSKNGQLHRP